MHEMNYTGLCQQAHYQIEAMCFTLCNAARAKDVDALPHLVQSLAIRIKQLNAAVMVAASGDNPDYTNDLHVLVYGSRMDVEVCDAS